jgi:hypothetical protein
VARVIDSRIEHDRRQIDGRRYVHEAHEIDTGAVWSVVYLADAKADAEKIMLARVPGIEAALTAQAADAAEQRVKEKARAEELLKLADAALARVLMVDEGAVADEKAKLSATATATVDDGAGR